MLLRFIFFVFLMVFTQTIFAIDPHQNHISRFISVADIHFDPFFGCSQRSCPVIRELQKTSYQNWPQVFEQYDSKKVAGIGHDTNYRLFKILLNQLNKVNKSDHPDFVIILGDFLAHDFREQYRKYSTDRSQASYEQFVNKTMQFIAYEFDQVFPSIDVYPVVGNNDTYNGDYYCIPGGKFFSDMTQIWGELIKDPDNRKNFRKMFPLAGFYQVSLAKNPNQKIIILNTVLFSTHVRRNELVKPTALKQLAWLQTQLQTLSTNNQHTFLAYHIPVGIDILATLESNFNKINEFWQSQYTTRFEEELRQYTPTITAILVGHLHIDTFPSMTLKKFAGIHEYVTPSVSPIFGNNPGFKIMSYDPQTFRLKKVGSYFYPLNQKETTVSLLWEHSVK